MHAVRANGAFEFGSIIDYALSDWIMFIFMLEVRSGFDSVG